MSLTAGGGRVVKLLRVSAFTNGQSEVSLYDAWLTTSLLMERAKSI